MNKGMKRLFVTAGLLAGLLQAHAAFALDKVKIAIIGASSDIGFYLAEDKGWFAQDGIEVEMISFDSGARMIAPMSTGEIDVGTGAISAGLYNAFERSITLHIVADKGRNVKGMSFQGLLVRKALLDSGEVKSVKDLKGRKMAFTGPGANDSAVIDEALRKVGLGGFNDVQSNYLGLPGHLPAYQNGAIDASIVPEAFRTAIIKSGAAGELMPVADLRDNDQVGAVVYSDTFVTKRRDVAQKVMNAYIKGVRFYNDALKDGKITGPHADEIIDSMAKHGNLKDKAKLREIIPTAIDSDGALDVASLAADLAFYKAQGLVKADIKVEQAVDLSFVKKAVQTLGPYKRP
jgi:NitT/TauT family transport system substrate-binding protein